MSTSAKSFAAQSPTTPLAPHTIARREPGPTDVAFEILFCGVCHSDLHQTRNEWESWGPTTYPCVPGHEIVGRVTAVGADVKNFRQGDLVATGCMVDSCGECVNCKNHIEVFCQKGATFTYNSPDQHGTAPVTYGGYSDSIVVDEAFVLSVPENLDPAAAAPLLCAGITTYSPLHHWKVGPGQKVGIIGLGGLGHMGVKFAHALGAHTVLFTTSESKVEDGKRLGADEVVISKDPEAVAKHAWSFDFILDCVSAEHDINTYLNLLKVDGTLCIVGMPEKPLSIASGSVVFGRRSFAGSAIGGIKETQEMLDFCGQHNLTSEIELIPIQKINEAYDRMLKNDIKYRFVIDMASLKN